MKYRVMIENNVVTGTSEEILIKLKNKSFFQQCSSLNEFIKKIQQDIWRLYGIGIQIDHNKSNIGNQIVDQLIHFGLLRIAHLKESFK